MLFKRLRILRKQNQKTQADIATILHVSQNTYSDYENGKINVPISILKKLAVYYQVSIDFLVGLTDNPEPYPPA